MGNLWKGRDRSGGYRWRSEFIVIKVQWYTEKSIVWAGRKSRDRRIAKRVRSIIRSDRDITVHRKVKDKSKSVQANTESPGHIQLPHKMVLNRWRE